jgi:hypothetical protein
LAGSSESFPRNLRKEFEGLLEETFIHKEDGRNGEPKSWASRQEEKEAAI